MSYSPYVLPHVVRAALLPVIVPPLWQWADRFRRQRQSLRQRKGA